MNIKNKEELLQNIADGLRSNDLGLVALDCIEVVFYEGDTQVGTFSLAEALDTLVNDIYYNEEYNWAEADRAEVRSM
jgi:hypothetical protein